MNDRAKLEWLEAIAGMLQCGLTLMDEEDDSRSVITAIRDDISFEKAIVLKEVKISEPVELPKIGGTS